MSVDDHPLVLVIGAAGAIGSALVRVLKDRYAVVGMDQRCQGTRIECIDTDVGEASSLAQAIGEFRRRHGDRVAAVVHLATYCDFSGEDHPLYQRVNVDGTAHLLSALDALQVDRLIYASTMRVHQPTMPGLPITEDSPLGPRWPYPQSAQAAENLIRRRAESNPPLPYVTLRLATLYDEDCRSPLLAHRIQRIREDAPGAHLFPGNPAHGQAFVHRDDLIDAMVRCIDARDRLPPALTLLIGEPSVMSYEALQQELGQLIHGETWSTHGVPKPLAQAEAWAERLAEKLIPDALDQGHKPFIGPFMVSIADDHFELDVSRARKYLGWEPKHTLRGVLPEMVERMKRDAAGFYRKNGLEVPGSRMPG